MLKVECNSYENMCERTLLVMDDKNCSPPKSSSIYIEISHELPDTSEVTAL
jgi:hypothetical protein